MDRYTWYEIQELMKIHKAVQLGGPAVEGN